MITKTVKEIGNINFTGNITPHKWFQHITKKETGRPYPLAALILSDIIYWYRPVYVRHETTNKIIGIRKKFKSDMLQKNYSNYAEFYGVTKHTIKRIFDRLIELGLLRRVFRTIIVNNLKLNNVMFIDPVPERIKQITELDDEEIESINSTKIEENEAELLDDNNFLYTPSSKFARRGSAILLGGGQQICKEGPSKFASTYTETTTETTTKDYNSNENGDKLEFKDESEKEVPDKFAAAVSNNLGKIKLILEEYKIRNGNLLKCLEVLSGKDMNYLDEKILITEFRDKKGKIEKNKSGYLIRAILDDIPPNKEEKNYIRNIAKERNEQESKQAEDDYYDYVDSEVDKYKNKTGKKEYNNQIENIIVKYTQNHPLMKNEISNSNMMKNTVIRNSMIEYLNLPDLEKWKQLRLKGVI